jgi:predicted unusual protein kinase regulating ubiquinone biosynthesis (AarF/ABC1/UbiB family)
MWFQSGLQNLFRRIPAVIKVAQIVCQTLEWKIPFMFDNVGADTFSPSEEQWMLELIQSKFGKHVQQDDLETVGCGTIGRVYRYNKYAIKVKIPGVLERIKRDLGWIEFVALWADRATMYAFFFHRKIRTVHESICRQNDFALELQNGMAFAKQMDTFGIDPEYMFVPRFYPDKSTENMIVMDYVQGTTIASLDNPRAYITRGAREELHKFLAYNLALFPLCHADLHVGNLMLERYTNKLAVIDFGMCTSKLPAKKIYTLLKMLQAAQKHDAVALAKLISLEYYIDNDRNKCINKFPDVFKDFEYEIVRTVHNSFDKSDLHIVHDCFRAAADWSLTNNVWGSRDMADVEVAAVVSLTNLSIIGLIPEVFRRHAKKIMEIEKAD